MTLPAESEPTIAAPVPQSTPSSGVAAKEATDQNSTAVPASRALRTPLCLILSSHVYCSCLSLKLYRWIGAAVLARRPAAPRRSGGSYGPERQ